MKQKKQSDLEILTARRAELRAQYDAALQGAAAIRANMGAAILKGESPESLSNRLTQLDSTAVAIRAALTAADSEISRLDEDRRAVLREQARLDLAVIDSECESAFIDVLDAADNLYMAILAYQDAAGRAASLIGPYHLTRGPGVKLLTWVTLIRGALADIMRKMRRAMPDLLAERPDYMPVYDMTTEASLANAPWPGHRDQLPAFVETETGKIIEVQPPYTWQERPFIPEHLRR